MENKGVEVSKNMTPTHIDLFAGIGGFSLGFEKAGIETLAHVEIDAKCQAVLKNHWPTHLLFSDVCEVGAHNLPYADIISFGSPCQDLSVAGKRAGLAGGRSGLFFEAARIIREIDPRYAVWENVPGALSSHNGRDFKSVIECLLDASVPMPRSGRWASSGMVRTGQKEIAWRVLDAQYFGVAQRRRRVFLVFCSGGRSASSILFEPEGLRWPAPTRNRSRQDYPAVTGTLAASGAGLDRPSRSGNQLDFCIPDEENLVGVRRLTPTECERLQGFPDGWTGEQADSSRYRQLGNAVCVPVAEWIGKRIVEATDATTP